jgi:RNA polymerase sigma factor (sigma-70 family)
MTQEQIPPNRAIELIDPELIRRLEAYVRSQRAGPRRIGLHTSDLVSGTVHRLIVQAGKHGNTLEYQDLRRLAYTVARGVVIDAIRAIARATHRNRSLDMDRQPRPAPVRQAPPDPYVQDALVRAMQTLPPDDHQLVFMRLRETNWEQIAASLGITAEAARKRWQRLLDELKPKLPT